MYAAITVNNLTKTYGKGDLAYHVLRGISLRIENGEAVAIMGKSGAGKSTLLHQIAALDTPSGGDIFYEDKNLKDFSATDLGYFRLYNFGYIFQDYALIKELTALENVKIPLLMRGLSFDEASSRAVEALRSVGLENKLLNLPSELSGGEQQRVSIARAIAGKPKILFADEPTANLDSKSGILIINLLKEIHKRGQTVVMVTHEASYAYWCDRILNIEDGQITSESKLTLS